MLLSAVSVFVVAQSSSEIPEGLMNNPVYRITMVELRHVVYKQTQLLPHYFNFASLRSHSQHRVSLVNIYGCVVLFWPSVSICYISFD